MDWMGLEAINKMGRAVKNNCSSSTIVLEPVLNEQTTLGVWYMYPIFSSYICRVLYSIFISGTVQR